MNASVTYDGFDLSREIKGEVKMQMTPEGANYFATLFSPRKIVITMPPNKMESLRELKPGAIIDFMAGTSKEQVTRKVKVVRRDWKYGKVYMLEQPS